MSADWITLLVLGSFIGWMVVTAWFLGKAVACLESIAKSLKEGE